MNQQGLFWPNGRNLFRRRPNPGLRVALWSLGGVAVALTAVATVYFR